MAQGNDTMLKFLWGEPYGLTDINPMWWHPDKLLQDFEDRVRTLKEEREAPNQPLPQKNSAKSSEDKAGTSSAKEAQPQRSSNSSEDKTDTSSTKEAQLPKRKASLQATLEVEGNVEITPVASGSGVPRLASSRKRPRTSTDKDDQAKDTAQASKGDKPSKPMFCKKSTAPGQGAKRLSEASVEDMVVSPDLDVFPLKQENEDLEQQEENNDAWAEDQMEQLEGDNSSQLSDGQEGQRSGTSSRLELEETGDEGSNIILTGSPVTSEVSKDGTMEPEEPELPPPAASPALPPPAPSPALPRISGILESRTKTPAPSRPGTIQTLTTNKNTLRLIELGAVTTGDIPLEMVATVFNVKKARDCTTEDIDPNAIQAQIKWHQKLRRQFEAHLNYILTQEDVPPAPTVLVPAYLKHSWWWTDTTHELAKIIANRYYGMPTSNHEAAYRNAKIEEEALDRAKLDPLIAGWWAINWRLQTLVKLSSTVGITDLPPRYIEKFKVSMDTLTLWIIWEMNHTNLMMSEAWRHSLPNGTVHVSNRLRGNPQRFGTQLKKWDASRDAMFRMTRLNRSSQWNMDPVEDQPWWIEYLPRPGAKGIGRPPGLRDKLPTQLAGTEFFPSLDKWTEEQPPFYPKHKAWGVTMMNLEDSASLVSHAEPALLYDPCPMANQDLREPQASMNTVGPGRKDTWPAPLNKDAFMHSQVGQQVFDVDNLSLVTDPGDPKDWCKITITPPGIPQVKTADSTQQRT